MHCVLASVSLTPVLVAGEKLMQLHMKVKSILDDADRQLMEFQKHTREYDRLQAKYGSYRHIAALGASISLLLVITHSPVHPIICSLTLFFSLARAKGSERISFMQHVTLTLWSLLIGFSVIFT